MEKTYIGIGVLLILCGARLTAGHPSLMCAQTGAGTGGAGKKHPLLGWGSRTGYFSIGAQKYDSKYGAAWKSAHHHNGVPAGLHYPAECFEREIPGNVESPFKVPHCPYKFNYFIVDLVDPCDRTNEFEMKMYAVKQKGMDGVERALAGWVHIELKLLDPSDEIRIVYLQMRDEYFNAVGEFVRDSNEQCPSSDEDLIVSPTNKQFLPCTATGLRETAPSQALYMVSREILLNETVKDPANGYIPEKDITRGIHVTWRLGEYWCNRHYMIRPEELNSSQRIQVSNSFSQTVTTQDTFEKRQNIGSELTGLALTTSSSVPEDLKCDELILNDDGNPTGAAPWIFSSNRSSIENDYYNPKYLHNVKGSGDQFQSCQLDPSRVGPDKARVFSGRCAHLFQTVNLTTGAPINPRNDQFQDCNMNSSSREFQGIKIVFQNSSDYRNQLYTNRTGFCNNSCRSPVDNKDVEEIKVYPVTDKGFVRIKTKSSYSERTSDSLAKFWRGRKFHGILCIICTMFVTPVSLFAARYLKETGMKHVFAGLQIWYWIHVANSLGLFAIYYSSQMAIQPSIASWGHSEDDFATTHYILGWISHAIFTLMLVFGGVRGGTHGSAVKIRKMIMTAHSVVGFAQYWINILLVLISTWIPASPSADYCGDDGFPSGLSKVAIFTLTWAILDILFHGAIMFIQISGDTKLGFKRPWYCPIVPILPNDSSSDMDGSFLRQIVFLVYLGISGTFTFATILTLGLSAQVPGCVFGEMTCKSPIGCSSAALAMCKHLKYTRCDA
ncbi:hypothetical protein Ocin01_17529 [Orchesella cincta]|uniref:Ferric-chelate reductase 1 n=1 Tax=Orchesella cincta TaxID=48709 RepID=A0A1D2M867_ORCCI|nr:hypothetical protein Ocin01_17529 [Orchesella cincta]